MIDLGFTVDDPTFVQGGWIPPADRTAEEQRIHNQFVVDTPVVREVFGGPEPVENKDRPRIWELTKLAVSRGLIPNDYIRNGHLKNCNQIEGSCVGFGMGTALLYSSMVDALIHNQSERIVLPFIPYHYGRGRMHSGIRGRGHGSFGSGQAKAITLDGYLSWDSLDVPKPTFGQTFRWTSAIETQWSDGARIGEQYVGEAKHHLCANVARCTTTAELRKLNDSYHVCTVASSWGGKMQCPVTDGVLLNKRSGTWNHQMCELDYIEHPRLGYLYWIANQWGYPHGTDPGGEWDRNTGAPPGGFFIGESDMQWILSREESFTLADPQGFVDLSRQFDWSELFGQKPVASRKKPRATSKGVAV